MPSEETSMMMIGPETSSFISSAKTGDRDIQKDVFDQIEIVHTTYKEIWWCPVLHKFNLSNTFTDVR